MLVDYESSEDEAPPREVKKQMVEETKSVSNSRQGILVDEDMLPPTPLGMCERVNQVRRSTHQLLSRESELI